MEINKLNIKAYFDKGTFIVPNYQRGYKWAVNDKEGTNSLAYFIDSLITSFNNCLPEYFIEAVTVVEDNGEIILVDGQQRTTTLFLLFIILEDFEFIKSKLKYDVREDSNTYLQQLVTDKGEISNKNDVQDIFYFNQALKIIAEKINSFKEQKKSIGNKEKVFKDYIKENIFLLYNKVEKEKAINTFIALNGLKAVMKDEELIKSEILIKSSRTELDKEKNIEEKNSIEWKINEDRGRLARNWDKWLYWWNRKEINTYFGIDKKHPLYYLLITYWNIYKSNTNSKKEFTFDNFKAEFLHSQRSAKINFEGLRKLQKTFEDYYNNYTTHNFLGLILKTSSSKEDALIYFLNIELENKISFEEYARWSLVNATHLEIIDNTQKKGDDGNMYIIKENKVKEAILLLSHKYVYWNENDAEITDNRKELAFRFLMLLNLMEDNKLERKFDFSVWENRSLEHIYPKSKRNNLNFDTEEFRNSSIHSIGNLVLLYGRDNSAFGAKDFNDKKNTYFNTAEEFKSRNLLHTISVFSKSDWGEKEIIENQKNAIKRINEYYGFK